MTIAEVPALWPVGGPVGGPVAVDVPDLSPWATGNIGLPYVWSWQAAVPGPHVAITALVHGNELCGAIVLDRLLREGLRPVRGRLSLVFCNVAAFASFDPAHPERARCCVEDFNRLWDDPAAPPGPLRIDSPERRRARELLPLLAEVDVLLDLHSMLLPGPALMLAGMQPRAVDLARAIGLPGWIVRDRGHSNGRRLRDWEAFDRGESARTALLVECGQHWQAETVGLCERVVRGFLDVTGCCPDRRRRLEAEAPVVVEISEVITARTEMFRFCGDYVGMERIARAGTIIAEDGGVLVRTPYDDCVLVMPTPRARPGTTAIRLGRIIG